MHIHILGICGTFMGGIALLARELGYNVSGQDANVYPPMSTQLQQAGITLTEGYNAEDLPDCDLVVVGNAMSRGNSAVEAVLNRRLAYTSGPQWLYEHILRNRYVIAVAGTHGKTTTTSMIAAILHHCGMQPGFLIGGVAADFGISARLGSDPFFVIEADEYDTAFFDKRSKFVHYHPQTVVLNNLEYDHADIFPDLAAIQRQFHHLIRTVPGRGKIIWPQPDEALQQVLAMGCWSEQEWLQHESGWSVLTSSVGEQSCLQISQQGREVGNICWSHHGQHNAHNALAAVAAAHHAGIAVADAIAALQQFAGVKRRLELRGEVAGVRVYDDFAHHPTAIATTLAGVRRIYPEDRIIAVLEPRSNTMRMGVHAQQLPQALADADSSHLFLGSVQWQPSQGVGTTHQSLDALIAAVVAETTVPTHIVVMSNGGFGGIHQRLLDALQQRN